MGRHRYNKIFKNGVNMKSTYYFLDYHLDRL
jgi:hypothetical protein